VEKIYKYPSIQCVKGYGRSILQDLQKHSYCFVPNTLVEIIKNIHGKTTNEYLKEHDISNHEIIKEYIDFLIDNKYVYLSEQTVSFDNDFHLFDYPAVISNTIVILSDTNIVNFQKIIFEIENVGCENIQIYIENQIQLQDIVDILTVFDNTRILSIEILLPFVDFLLNVSIITDLFEKQARLFKMQVYNAPDSNISYVDTLKCKNITYNKENISYLDCGFVHPVAFRNNISFFSEARNYNTCLNKKLCIDSKGNIKNCPVMKSNFGNISQVVVQEVVQKKEFQSFWHISKDKIDVCKDCEFRYMCMDCRCFLKYPNNIYSQPEKCTYNPYICKWKGQEGYISVEECGTYTTENGFVPDDEKIDKINNQIWGE